MLAAMAIFTCSAAIAPEAEKLSVYEAIGGRAAVVAAVDRFYGSCWTTMCWARFSLVASGFGTGRMWSRSR